MCRHVLSLACEISAAAIWTSAGIVQPFLKGFLARNSCSHDVAVTQTDPEQIAGCAARAVSLKKEEKREKKIAGWVNNDNKNTFRLNHLN